MLRWTDIESRSPEEVLAAARARKRQAISEAVRFAVQEFRQKKVTDLENWIKDAEICLNNGLRIYLIKQALTNNQLDLAKKHLKFITPRDAIEQAEYDHIVQDYNDKAIEAQTRRLEKLRGRSKPVLTISQEMMLKEIVEVADRGSKYTSLVNHGAARQAAEALERKGLITIIYSPDKTVQSSNKSRRTRRLIETVVPTPAGYALLSGGDDVVSV